MQGGHILPRLAAFAVDASSQPAVGFVLALGLGGVPDVHRTKMRSVRVRIADALNNRQVLILVQLLEAGHLRMQAELIVQLQDLIIRNAKHNPVSAVTIVAERYNRIQTVVAAAQLYDDENLVARALLPGGLSAASQKGGHG